MTAHRVPNDPMQSSCANTRAAMAVAVAVAEGFEPYSEILIRRLLMP
jgi:hypothetical protein